MPHGPELLRILSDGRFHSGEALGKALGVGRAAVWKRIRALRAAGLDLDSVPGRGYRLAEPLELLDPEIVAAALDASVRAGLGPLEVHHEVDSTNSELLRRAAVLPSGAVCLAESQRAGRGRRGRVWHSPCARNLYLSLLWRFSRGPEALGGLALVVGLAVRAALEDAGVPGVAVKWPNDVLHQGAKLAGALIELSGEAGGASCVIIGVGINVSMPQALGSAAITQAWTDAERAAGAPVSRNRLAAAVLGRLSAALALFGEQGLEPFLDEWRAHDALAGRPVVVQGMEIVHGIARGVDVDGALLMEDEAGVVSRWLSGDVSVRAEGEAKP
ncbi:MAG: bifunctional biotin--[acetyl-CoA-carboxylase] ligase/biotin operon repressor BirA [Gammaproteobacteria bacterium]|jgi:BirA family biotin operon repressor/biotin-[acetyl-CoA-carboxylase] ligase|nr:bifunctional biotin--[acetyl-CoA-carboxylase] ligase/biotin operon repressor BirA [Gammaproteobacteria bacterium]